ncbi:MAG: hypothetical protein ABIP51_16245 [Bacteroidia bacterium]
MNTFKKISFLTFIFLLGSNLNVLAQDTDDEMPEKPQKQKKTLVGMYVGAYFGNKYSASTYNGYGFDYEGNRNNFTNSLMNQKINNQYAGKYGQQDQIAAALGVDPGNWTFNESDMPQNMHYTPSIMVGFNFRHSVNKSAAILFNINGSKLNLEGNFTMTILKPQNPNPALNNNIQSFGIKGREQRLLFQLGFQKLLGDDDKLNFFVEAGFIGTLAKIDRSLIMINNLTINLMDYYNQTLYPAPGPTRTQIGFGVGAFAGLGLNVDINPKFLVQLLYSPSFEKINIGTSPTLKLQNAIGFRAYYKI